ncbi:hypothetical protein [Mucilaginibacter lacusdianchii]|uniref:hypothetical protein n=1 Tax=Mucilaginibacter lacusdianchii TaxID=2684211 RepID=UPI00131AA14D|nr:hypothetical protein [Mucilaginibacter sp. JXJ CY 39]
MKPNVSISKVLVSAFVSVVIICLSAYSEAQTKSIKLTLKDKLTQESIEHANATLIDLKDSLILASQLSHDDGIVNFNIKKAGKYKIVVEKEGYVSETCYSTFSNKQDDSQMYFTLVMNKKRRGK